MPKQRRIIIVAGPNGAGKTTFAREYLLKEAHCPDFVNVDLIAAGLSPFDPDRAAIRAQRLCTLSGVSWSAIQCQVSGNKVSWQEHRR